MADRRFAPNRTTVLFNDLAAHRRRTGVGHYAAELCGRLAEDGGLFEVLPVSRTPIGSLLASLSRAYSAASVGGEGGASRSRRADAGRLVKTMGRRLFASLAPAIGRGQIDLFHEPDAIPLPIKAATVATVHDLSVLLYPEWHPEDRVRGYEEDLAEAVARTSVFIADSHATKRDMIHRLGVDPDRVEVVYPAPREIFRVMARPEVERAIGRLGLPPRYLLFMGTIEPRKNVAGLLRAFASLPETIRRQCPLVLAGGWGWRCDDVRRMLEEPPWRDQVRWLGYLCDEDLVAVANGAQVVVYPSFYEGFGLPPLEAMASGVPVITTHAGSLEEVVGQAAMIVDPADERQLARAIEQVLGDRDLANEYVRRGRERVRRYSWEETARRTRAAYQRALEPVEIRRAA